MNESLNNNSAKSCDDNCESERAEHVDSEWNYADD